MKHMIKRTSPKGKGQEFIGTCRLCGKEGLSAYAPLEECDNPRGLSFEEGFMETIKGGKDESNNQTNH